VTSTQQFQKKAQLRLGKADRTPVSESQQI